ncbi:MAG: terminase large subunit [Planctomyces sp.]|nr:terminase large subunit [Planctomyces sp.]
MNSAQIIQQYVDGVKSGRIVAGRLQQLAVERYLNDLKRAQSKTCPFYFDQATAETAIEFFPLLLHSSAEFQGKPFHLEPDQMFIVWNLMGWKRIANNARRFRYAHIEAARKWGKTAFAAALMLMLFLLDGEGRPEIYCAATKRSQSKLVWEEAQRFVEGREFLKSRITIKESLHTMLKADKGIIRALGADGGGSDGFFPSTVVFDELHEWKTRAQLKLWAKLRTGSAARPQPIFVVITTAGDDQSRLWQTEREYACKILHGKAQDDSLFAFILCIDDEDDMFDKSCWPKANPHLGTTAKWESYEELAEKARLNPADARDFERYYTNRKVASITRAIPDRAWVLGAKPIPSLAGRVCHGAVDLGFRDDLSAFGLVFPPLSANGLWYCKARAFCPSDGPRDLTAEPIASLIKSGHIVVTEGNTTDVHAIHAAIDHARQIYNLKSMACDPNNAAQFGAELVGKGIDCADFKQTTANYNEPMREFLKLLADGKFIHGDDPLLNWCQQNMQAYTNVAGLMMPSKQASSEKIDPLVSILMAFAESLHFQRKLISKPVGQVVRFL